MKNNSKRVNSLAFIVYPESQDIVNVYEYLEKYAYTAAISPLHSGDSEDTKPHYHVLVKLSSPRQLSTLNEEFNAAFNKTEAFSVGSLRGYARYLMHLDNPEKEQFADGIKPMLINGFDWAKFTYTPVEVYDQAAVVKAIVDLKHNNDVSRIDELIIMFSAEGKDEYVAWVCSHAYLVSQILR